MSDVDPRDRVWAAVINRQLDQSVMPEIVTVVWFDTLAEARHWMWEAIGGGACCGHLSDAYTSPVALFPHAFVTDPRSAIRQAADRARQGHPVRQFVPFSKAEAKRERRAVRP